jgi:hypothetical protein
MINVKWEWNGWWTVYAPRFGLACHPAEIQCALPAVEDDLEELDVGTSTELSCDHA